MRSYRLVDSRRCRLKSAAWTEDREKPEKMVAQPQLGPNQTTRLQARLVLQRGCRKNPGHVWSLGCRVEGAAVAKNPFSQDELIPHCSLSCWERLWVPHSEPASMG